MPISKYELKELIEELEKIRGRHTELVTVMIPAEANIYTVANQIDAERSTADNIKSKTTRKNVLDALESISRELKLYTKTPENGMVLFCGNTSEKEGQANLKLWAIEPPYPLKVRMYRCDQTFVLDPLKEMLEVEQVYGLVVIDRKEATLGLLEGKQIKVLRKLSSGVPGKIRAGGQSSQRFERITEGLAKEFFRRVADSMKDVYFSLPKLKGILIGGPIPTKEEFVKEGNLATALKEKIIGIKDLGYADEHGLKLLVESSHELLAQQEIIHEKKLLEKLFEQIGKNDRAVYGEKEVEKALDFGAVHTLIISEKLSKEKAKHFIHKAQESSTQIEVVSTETEEGEQFYNLGGVGAILRYDIKHR